MKMVYALIALTSIGIHAAELVRADRISADKDEAALIQKFLAPWKKSAGYAPNKKAFDSWWERPVLYPCHGEAVETEHGKQRIIGTQVYYQKDKNGTVNPLIVKHEYDDREETCIETTIPVYSDGREDGKITGRFPADTKEIPGSLRLRRAMRAAYFAKFPGAGGV